MPETWMIEWHDWQPTPGNPATLTGRWIVRPTGAGIAIVCPATEDLRLRRARQINATIALFKQFTDDLWHLVPDLTHAG